MRPKVDMDERTFDLALRWVRVFRDRGTQGELNLAGIGESTLHPQFVRFVHLAREAVGVDGSLVLATNGLLMTDELAREIAPAQVRVYVSLHRPEKAGPAIEALKRAGLYAGASADPSVAATDWAGQVKWHRSAPGHRQCMWVRGGKVIVLADGRVSRCSFDASGVGTICRVDDDLLARSTSPYSLCHTCDQDVGVPLAAAAANA